MAARQVRRVVRVLGVDDERLVSVERAGGAGRGQRQVGSVGAVRDATAVQRQRIR
jgi:hypothetical protein